MALRKKKTRPDPDALSTPLTPAQFHILLTLAEGQRHGYGIMREIKEGTDGGVELGPGTLYRSIKQLLARRLVMEVKSEGGPSPGPGRSRRIYALTPDGRGCALEEVRRLQALTRWAEGAMALEGGKP